MFKLCCFLALIVALHALPQPQGEQDVQDVPEVKDVQDVQEVVVIQPKNTHKPVTSTKSPPEVVEILESAAETNEDGSYHFHFRAEDGSFREETAVWMNPGTKKAYLAVSGAYSYFDVNGKEVVVNYKADNKGFVPEGGNIPEAIAVSAKRNSELPPQVMDKDDEEEEDDVVVKKEN